MKIDKFMAATFLIIHLGMILNMSNTSNLYTELTVLFALVGYFFLIRVIYHKIKKEALK